VKVARINAETIARLRKALKDDDLAEWDHLTREEVDRRGAEGAPSLENRGNNVPTSRSDSANYI
jgi:hypothetical protein